MSDSVNGVSNVKLRDIRESKVALRPVNRQNEKYLQLVESVRLKGVLLPILLREIEIIDDDGKKSQAYGLIDGLHRFTAAKDAGLEMIPASIKNMSDADVLDAQTIANLHRIETKPAEYTKHLLRILSSNPLMTEKELAKKLCVSDTFIMQRLSLKNLDDNIQELVNNDRVPLTSAYALAKLPVEEQIDFVDRAMTDDPTVFCPAVAARIKEIRDAKIQGRNAKPADFTPVEHFQKMKDIKDEISHSIVGPVLLEAYGVSNVVDAWALALKWVLKSDPESIRVQKEKWDERKQKQEEDRERRKKEREEQKAKAAIEKQNELSELLV